MWLTNNILREILYKNNSLCCLCLKATGENALHVYDEVDLKDPKITIEFSSLISSVFGNKIAEVEFFSHTICEECAKSAIQAYKFIHKCLDINEKMTRILCNLINCLDKANDEIIVKTRGIYVAIDPKSFQSKGYCDSKKSVIKKSVLLKRFRAFLRTEDCDKNDEKNCLLSFSQKECDICGIVFTHSDSLIKHKKMNCKKTNIDEQTVEINNEDNDDFEREQIGLRKQQTKLYFQNLERVCCEHCGSSCCNKYSLKKHMLKSCKVIKDKLTTEDSNKYLGYLANLKKKSNNKSQSYTISSDKLKNTAKMKPQSETVTCNYCEKSFQSKSLLKLHIHRLCKNAPSELKQSICSLCGKVISKYTMKMHERTHTSHFECSKCNKVFKTLATYKKHSLIPNCTEKPVEFLPPIRKYSCHICAKMFAVKSYLSGHIKARHSDFGFECTLCKKKLSSEYSLKLHMVVHTKQKNFECETCGGKFVSKFSLLYHTRTHTGEKPYKCKYCDNRFLSASRRNIHTRIHHLPPQLECKYCMKMFKHWGSLDRHRKRHFNPNSSLYMGNVKPQTQGKNITKNDITRSKDEYSSS